MILDELYTIHKMLIEKTSGLNYLSEFIKVLKPYSWQISHMRYIDQKEWKRITVDVDSTMSRKKSDKDEYLKIDSIQRINTEKLKKIVSRKGCITISRFGMIASHSAWLIVQHSDHDKDFQKNYLKLMKDKRDDVFKEDIKRLEKRIIG
jgi:hypothetical protein